DPYHGQDDLKRKRLRHVSPAFSEDPLRVLRVARFAARYAHLGFSVADETLTLMQQLSQTDELEHLTAERVWKEFERALTERSPEIFLQVLHQSGAIKKVLPELTDTLNDPDFSKHFAILCHKNESAIVRFAGLLSLAKNIDILRFCDRLRAPNSYKELALQCNKHHQQLAQFDHLDAQTKLDTLLQLDLIRRPQRLPQLRLCLDTLHDTVQLDSLPPILEQIALIQPKQLMAEGFTGPASTTEAQTLADTLNSVRPNSAHAFQADLNNMNEVEQLAQNSLKHWGRIDLLVNNASSFYPTPLNESTQAQWDGLINSNLRAPYFLSAALSNTLSLHR
ncbi:unnamed protein product, partial [Cyprideis torosa]